MTRPRYTPTTCFETFPFPESSAEQWERIAEAARELDRLRTGWLNPPEWTREEVLEFPGSVDGPWARYIDLATIQFVVPPLGGSSPASHHGNAGPPEGGTTNGGIGTVRCPRRVPNSDEAARELAKRTLTNLYNQRPTWLVLAHQKLDSAVFAAYGWPDTLSDDEILERLLTLNLRRDPGK